MGVTAYTHDREEQNALPDERHTSSRRVDFG